VIKLLWPAPAPTPSAVTGVLHRDQQERAADDQRGARQDARVERFRLPTGHDPGEQQHHRHGEQVHREHHADGGEVQGEPATPGRERDDRAPDELEHDPGAGQPPRPGPGARGRRQQRRVGEGREDHAERDAEERRVDLLEPVHREHGAERPHEGGGHREAGVLPAHVRDPARRRHDERARDHQRHAGQRRGLRQLAQRDRRDGDAPERYGHEQRRGTRGADPILAEVEERPAEEEVEEAADAEVRDRRRREVRDPRQVAGDRARQRKHRPCDEQLQEGREVGVVELADGADVDALEEPEADPGRGRPQDARHAGGTDCPFAFATDPPK
jgi:hypothetical protein